MMGKLNLMLQAETGHWARQENHWTMSSHCIKQKDVRC